MATVIFIYNGNQTLIQCSEDEKMQDICQRFVSKNSVDINNIDFLYGGKTINYNTTFSEISNQFDKIGHKMKVLVLDNNAISEKSIIKSKEIICPKCGENCLFHINNYKIRLSDCKNGHITDNILFNNYNNTQIINESKILCNLCQNTKDKAYNKQFFKCLMCKKNLCPLCNLNHNKKHKIIDYDKKDYICNIHGELYISYCQNCKENLCMQCEINHNNHKIMPYKDIMPKENEIKKKIEIFREKINKINDDMQKIITILYKVNENMELYYKIINDIMNNYDIQNRNYEIFKNINDIQSNINFNDIDKIINTNDISNKFGHILNLYNKINLNNEIYQENVKKNNVMTIRYRIKGRDEIKIFSEDFVKNNIDKSILIINGKETKLCQFLDVTKLNKQETLEIKLKELKPITTFYRMFRDCYDLIALPDISEWDTTNITDLHSIFNGCSSLSVLSDISKWNTSNVTSLECLFWNCVSLKEFPDISKWNISKVTNLHNLFSQCWNIKNVPDISKWDTSNVTDMSCIFKGCTSLLSLPDISKWNTSNVTDMHEMFLNCSSLFTFPDISKWNVNKVTNFNSMFDGCKCSIKFKKINNIYY